MLKFSIYNTTNSYYQGSANLTLSNIDQSGLCTTNYTQICDFNGTLGLSVGIFSSGVHAKYYNNLNFTGLPVIDQDENLISYN